MKLMTDKRYVLYYNLLFCEYFVRDVHWFNRVFGNRQECDVIPILYTNSEDIAINAKSELKRTLGFKN